MRAYSTLPKNDAFLIRHGMTKSKVRAGPQDYEQVLMTSSQVSRLVKVAILRPPVFTVLRTQPPEDGAPSRAAPQRSVYK